MNHIVRKVNNRSLCCPRILVLPWLRPTAFRFYLEVPFLSLWFSMQTKVFISHFINDSFDIPVTLASVGLRFACRYLRNRALF